MSIHNQDRFQLNSNKTLFTSTGYKWNYDIWTAIKCLSLFVSSPLSIAVRTQAGPLQAPKGETKIEKDLYVTSTLTFLANVKPCHFLSAVSETQEPRKYHCYSLPCCPCILSSKLCTKWIVKLNHNNHSYYLLLFSLTYILSILVPLTVFNCEN